MTTKQIEFITKHRLKQYFVGSLPYCVVDGVEVPVAIVNDTHEYPYDKKTYMRANTEMDKYLLPPNPTKLILKKRNDSRLVLLNNCSVEDFDFNFIKENKIGMALRYSSFTTIEAEIKYKVGNGLHVTDNMLSYDELDPNKNYNGIPYFNEDYFRNNLTGGIDTTSRKKNHCESIKLAENKASKIPSYFFEDKPFFINLTKYTDKGMYAFFPKGLEIVGFSINLADTSIISNDGTNMVCQSESLEILNKQQLRAIIIDNLLNDL